MNAKNKSRKYIYSPTTLVIGAFVSKCRNVKKTKAFRSFVFVGMIEITVLVLCIYEAKSSGREASFR